ncbi:hypothetical protein D9M73_293150 [compost metagenome]
MAVDAAGLVDGVGQRFGHGHARQAVLGQRFQLGAKVLQGGHVALALRLAFRFVVFRFGRKASGKARAIRITGISRHARHFILL